MHLRGQHRIEEPIPRRDGQSRRVQEAEIKSQVVADDRRRGGRQERRQGREIDRGGIDQIDAVSGGQLHELERIAARIKTRGFDIEPEDIGCEKVRERVGESIVGGDASNPRC